MRPWRIALIAGGVILGAPVAVMLLENQATSVRRKQTSACYQLEQQAFPGVSINGSGPEWGKMNGAIKGCMASAGYHWTSYRDSCTIVSNGSEPDCYTNDSLGEQIEEWIDHTSRNWANSDGSIYCAIVRDWPEWCWKRYEEKNRGAPHGETHEQCIKRVRAANPDLPTADQVDHAKGELSEEGAMCP